MHRLRSLLVVVAFVGFLQAAPVTERAARIASLVKQLGDDEFTRREAASRALEAIGEPVLAPLREVAASSDDCEVRRRAEKIVRTLTERAAAVDQEKLEGRWQGVFQEDNGKDRPLDSVTVAITEGVSVAKDRFGLELFRCSWKVVDPTVSPKKVDLVLPDGKTFYAVYTLDGNTLTYCGSYQQRPESLATRAGDGRYLATLKRAEP